MTRLRPVLAAVAGALCVVGVVASVLAVWADRVLFDPDSVAGAVEATLDEPEVTDAVGRYVADELLDAIDLRGRVDGRVPDELVDLVVGGLRSVVAEGIADVLADDDVRTALGRVAAASHRRLLVVLDGGRLVDGVNADDDGVVRFNVLPLLGRGIELVQDRGFLTDVRIPDLNAAGDPGEQIEALEAATGRALPDDFGQLVVYRSEQVGQARLAVARAQQAVVLFRTSVVAIVAVAALALVATLALARNRARAVAVVAAGSILALALARLAIGRVVSDAPTLAVDPGARAAIRSMVETLASGLVTLLSVGFLAGVALLAAAWILARRRPRPGPTALEVP